MNHGVIPWECRYCIPRAQDCLTTIETRALLRSTVQNYAGYNRNMSERIALDLRNYQIKGTLDNIIADSASLAIEASSNVTTPKVNPHHYVKINEKSVISPGRDKRDVRQKFTNETELDAAATSAGNEIVRILLEENVGSTFVWFSPSDPYPEARVVVGTKRETKSKRFEYLECYGISTVLSREETLKYAQLCTSLSSEKISFPTDPEDLRSLVISIPIPNNRDPFEYLSEIIQLPEKNRFESILNKKSLKNKAAAVKAAVIATAPIRSNPNVIYSNPIGYGAYVETQMKYLGFGMNPKKFGCGISNLDMQNNGYYTNSTNLSEYTEVSMSGDGLGPSEFSCPACGQINKRPFGGYVKSCQNPKCERPEAVMCG